jgi:rhodanese-related sulfurtransferase
MLTIFKKLFSNKGYRNLRFTEFLAEYRATPGAVLLDVRTPGEVAAGKLKNALNIDFRNPSFDAKIEKLDREKSYFLYCRSGVRSANACKKMHKMGFTKLVNLSGGYISI